MSKEILDPKEQLELCVAFGRLLAIYEDSIDPFPRPTWVKRAFHISKKLTESGFRHPEHQPIRDGR